jgi:hypothetical protein
MLRHVLVLRDNKVTRGYLTGTGSVLLSTKEESKSTAYSKVIELEKAFKELKEICQFLKPKTSSTYQERSMTE